MSETPNPDTINEAKAALALYDEDGFLDNNDLQRVMPLVRWALAILDDLEPPMIERMRVPNEEK